MAEKKVEFVMSLNTDRFSSNLKRAEQELRVAKNEILEAGDGIKKFGANLQTLSEKYNAINSAIQKNNDKMKLYEQEIEKINGKTKEQINGLKDLATAKEQASKKYDEMVKLYGKESEEAKKAKEEVDALSKKYKQQEESINGNVKKMDNYTVKLSDVKRENSGLETELKKVSDAIEKEGNSFLKASEKLEQASNKMKSIGDGFSNVGDSILKITTPIITAGAGIATFTMSFEDSMAKVSTLSDESGIGIDVFRDKIIALSNETGKPVDELAESLYNVLSSGVEASKSVEFLAMANELATAGFTDTGKSVDILTTCINAYGLEVEDTQRISDILIETQNKGKTTIDELASSMGKVIPTASANSVSIEQLGSAYAIMTSNGIATAESTTYLNSMLNEMGETGSDTDKILREMSGKSFKELMDSGSSLGDVLNILSDYAEASGLNLQDLFSSSEAGKASLVLSKNAGDDFNKMLEEMNGSLGATDKAFQKVDETTGSKLKKSINELKNAFLGMGDNLAPVIERVTEAIKKVAEAIGDMDDETIDNIISWTKLGTEIGIAAKIIGGVFGTFNTVTTGLSKMASMLGKVAGASSTLAGSATSAGSAVGASGLGGSLSALSGVAVPLVGVIGALGTAYVGLSSYMEVANGTCTKAKEEYSLLEQGMAKLMGVSLQTREELEEQNLVYKDFGDNISPSFQSAVEAMREDIANFNLALSETSLDGVLSQEEIDSLSTQVQTAVDGAITAINEKSEETQQAMSDLFATDGIFTEKEREIMNWWSTRGDKEKEEAVTLQAEINEIEQTAFSEGRALTPEEEQAITDRYERIKQIELMAKAKNNDELTYAQIDFQNQVATLDAEGASQLMKQKLAQADELKIQKKNEIDMLKIQAKEGYDQMSEEDKAYADKMCEELDNAWKSYLEQDQTFRDNLYDQAIESNSNLKGEINKFNGELLTEQDKSYHDNLILAKEHYQGINEVTESGYQRMLNTATGQWEELYVMVDDKTGQVVGCYNYNSDECSAMNKSIGKNLENIAIAYKNTTNTTIDALSKSSSASVDNAGRIKDASGKIVGSLKDIKDNADGTRTGIINLNGQSIKVKVDKDGTISNLNEIQRKINGIQGKYVSITVDAQLTATAARYARGGTIMMPYATGTPNTSENQMAIINEKGWELVDTKPNVEAYAVSSITNGDIAYIPEGTSIKSNLTSTQMMKAEIKKEIAKYQNNITYDDLRGFAERIVDAIRKYSNVDINIDNDFNIAQTIDSEWEEERLSNNIGDVISSELRRFGKIVTKK